MDSDDVKIFGFWIYLMTDLVIFAVLLAAFIVLRTSTFGGPTGHELFRMPFALAETLILLSSSFTCSLATYSVFQKRTNLVIFWFVVTFLLGCAFLYLELTEFSTFVLRGASWRRSGFLSSFFALVGTHGFHISIGLMWMLVTIFSLWYQKLSEAAISRIFRLALFWHFLDIVWIFIFTTVYGMEHLMNRFI